MLRYTQIHAHARSIAQLGNVISAMRGVAAARAQQSKQQLESVRRYADIVTGAISQILPIVPDEVIQRNDVHATKAVVLIGAEHGFAGAFSEHILTSAGSEIASLVLLVIGSRALRLVSARGLKPVWNAQMVSQLSNTSALADRICTELYHQIQIGHVNSIDVIHAKPVEPQGFEILRQQLLPLDYTRFRQDEARQAPILNLTPQALLDRLTGEYLFAQLNEAIVHSFAAENSARLQTMNAARENIKQRMESLTSDERLARQSEITAEIVELATGSMAADRS